MAWQFWVVTGGLWVADRIYNKGINPIDWFDSGKSPKPWNEVQIPIAEEGSTIALIYGRCRVRSPVLAWASKPLATSDGNTAGERAGAPFLYGINLMYVLGIPVNNGLQKIYRVFAGDDELKRPASGSTWALEDLTGAGNEGLPPNVKNSVVLMHREADGLAFVGGRVEMLNGNSGQQLVDGAGTPTTKAADLMLDALVGNVTSGTQIPGYRGYMIATLHTSGIVVTGGHDLGFSIGSSPTPPAFSFEISSYPAFSDAMNVGLEMNPAEVLLDLLTGSMGKLGLSIDQIDLPSFGNAKIRLNEEGNGYSRAITDAKDAGEIIAEVLDQIDGVMYEDLSTGKIKLKLIRPDYDVAALPHITVSNCVSLDGFAVVGTAGSVNKVVVKFPNRDRDYNPDSATAHNQAVAFRDGASEVTLDYPGVCTSTLAKALASRELNARCRPLTKCTAIVNREFYAVNPGDPVKLTWPEYGVDGRVFRVGGVDRGTLENGSIRLDLIEDFFFVWRGSVVTRPSMEPHPGIPPGGLTGA